MRRILPLHHCVVQLVVAVGIIATFAVASPASRGLQRRSMSAMDAEAANNLCPQTLFTQILSAPLTSTSDPNDADPNAKWILSLCAADTTCGAPGQAIGAFVSRQYADTCVPLATTLSSLGWVPTLAPGVNAIFYGSLVVPNDVVVNVTVTCDVTASTLVSDGPVVKSFARGNATTATQVWQYNIPLRSTHACPAAPPQPVKFVTLSTDSHALVTVPMALPAGAHKYVVIEPGTLMGLDVVLEIVGDGDTNPVCNGPVVFDMSRGKPLSPLGPLIDKTSGPSVGDPPSVGGSAPSGGEPSSFSWNSLVVVFASSSLCSGNNKEAAIAVHNTGDDIPPPLALNASSTASFVWDLANGERNVSAASKLALVESGKLAYYFLVESRIDPRKYPGITCSLNLYVSVHKTSYSTAAFVMVTLLCIVLTGFIVYMLRRTWEARAYIKRTEAAIRPPDFPAFYMVACAIPLVAARTLVLLGKTIAIKCGAVQEPRRARAGSSNGTGRAARSSSGTEAPGAPLSGAEMVELDARSSLARSASDASPPSTARTASPITAAAAPPSAARATSPEEDEKLCRICKEDESEESLIAPCKCTGSIRWMHPSCLAHWRVEAAKRNARYTSHCEICQHAFDTRLVPKTSVMNLLAARYQFMGLCILVGWIITLLVGVLITQTAAAVSCSDPWHDAWTSFAGVVCIGFASYLIGLFILYTAAYCVDREAQALRIAKGQHPRALDFYSELMWGALPRAIFFVAYFTVIGYFWVWFLYLANDNIAWTVEWRVDAGFYWTFVVGALVVVIADGVGERPEAQRGGDPAPLLGGHDSQDGVTAPHDAVAAETAAADTDATLTGTLSGSLRSGTFNASSGNDGSPLIPPGAVAVSMPRVAADTTTTAASSTVRTLTPVPAVAANGGRPSPAPTAVAAAAMTGGHGGVTVVDTGRGWRDSCGESIDGNHSDRGEGEGEGDGLDDEEESFVGHHHDAINGGA